MDPRTIGALVDSAIPFLGGLYATFLGFRWIGPKAGENFTYDRRHDMYFHWFKWGGPLLMGFAVFQFVAHLLKGR